MLFCEVNYFFYNLYFRENNTYCTEGMHGGTIRVNWKIMFTITTHFFANIYLHSTQCDAVLLCIC